MLNEKCRYTKICQYYCQGAFTCGNDEEAKDYCGVFPVYARAESSQNNTTNFAKPLRLVRISKRLI